MTAVRERARARARSNRCGTLTMPLLSRAGGACEHRVGCFFSLEMNTWADALLALSVMQATANDIHQRWRALDGTTTRAATEAIHGLRSLREATPSAGGSRASARGSRSTASGSGSTGRGSRSMGKHRRASALHVPRADVAALRAAGVAGVKPLFPPPMLMIREVGHTPRATDDVRRFPVC